MLANSPRDFNFNLGEDADALAFSAGEESIDGADAGGQCFFNRAAIQGGGWTAAEHHFARAF